MWYLCVSWYERERIKREINKPTNVPSLHATLPKTNAIHTFIFDIDEKTPYAHSAAE